MKIILKGDKLKLEKLLKKESLWMKRNNIEVINEAKVSNDIQEPKKRGPKPKNKE